MLLSLHATPEIAILAKISRSFVVPNVIGVLAGIVGLCGLAFTHSLGSAESLAK